MLGDCVETDWWRNRQGYGYKSSRLAHRAAWEEVNGEIPKGMCVLHECDNPPCVNIGHLYLGTRKDNAQDREARGRGVHVTGEQHGGCKLSDQDVCDIREVYGKGVISHRELAFLAGVTHVHIGHIVRMKYRV